ncbi:spiro-SPASM protein [Brachyspira hampsonii]|uniref:Radical SAM protein n=1 Tax=Brachyspira hampsonii 30446 TaxID=1289135 RepID=A0A2U4F3N5_9SPIR|nr:spiro-SPASM protein [Brachyspira hampsonii]EKV57107.1 radical SAM protein [Brachyspira hampsonii 30446]MBW5388824.1 spiro-SPASM protein [Brachyspira hampsonii]MBW5394184.1 spiro-SPASM protein [Brachyspira hampsonii]OEJ16910.1 spiro-SPASM protein [Brachyspira hampsonii]
MSFLILADRTFSNEFSIIFDDIFNDKINTLKEKLNCDVKYIENNDLEKIENYLNNIYRESENYDNIIYIPGNMPLFNADETIKLTKIHEENISYFSYGENYPAGIVPFIIRRTAFEKLFNIIKTKDIKVSENAISNIVFVDPNFFEIEILISEYDMRYYRLYLFADSKRNAILIKKLIAYKDYNEMVKAIEENPSIRRTLPSFIEIDISNRQNVLNKYLLKNQTIKNELSKEEKNITLDEFKTIYDKLYNFCGDFHISIGSYYEPLLNKDIFDILEYSTRNKNVQVYLETNALLLDSVNAKRLLSMQSERDNLNVIIHLDAVEEDVYNIIYDSGDIKTIMSNIDYYLLREPKNTYLQITKQKDNFDYLASYYKYFDKYKIDIIMQKYYNYRGIIDDNRVGDMAPLINVGCWHLARDLFIDSYGDIYICRFDINKEKKIASIYEENLEDIWKKLENYFLDNVSKKLDFCNNCDEWYLYNF